MSTSNCNHILSPTRYKSYLRLIEWLSVYLRINNAIDSRDALFVETYPTFLTGLADIRNLIISLLSLANVVGLQETYTIFSADNVPQYVTSLVQLPLLRDLAELY